MKICFIGAGNMGKAMIGGVVKSKIFDVNDIYVSDPYKPGLENVKKTFGVNIVEENEKAISECDIIVFAVKPNVIRGVLTSAKDVITKDKVIVSIAAAVTIADIESCIGNDKKVIRVMPNTPALVGEGMSAISKNANITDEDLKLVLDIFNSFGKTEIVSENLMDAVTGVSGSGPAYVFMFIESMADAAVLSGIPRDKAYKFAAQTVYGAAKMVLETGKHPGELKDMVCSPAGTTIKAVEVLEEYGLRNAVIKGQLACVEKSIEMKK